MQVKNYLFILFFLTVSKLVAQKQDFSGTWQMKDQQSISGKLYSNGSPKELKVTQTPGTITIEKTTAGGSGDVTTTETINDGKPFETVTASKRKKVITIKWTADQKSFTEIANIYSATDPAKLEFTYTDDWSIEDGKLIFIRKAENFTNGEVWQSKAVYEKE